MGYSSEEADVELTLHRVVDDGRQVDQVKQDKPSEAQNAQNDASSRVDGGHTSPADHEGVLPGEKPKAKGLNESCSEGKHDPTQPKQEVHSAPGVEGGGTVTTSGLSQGMRHCDQHPHFTHSKAWRGSYLMNH